MYRKNTLLTVSIFLVLMTGLMILSFIVQDSTLDAANYFLSLS